MFASVEKKTVKTTFLDNFRSRKISKENILGGVFLLAKSKALYYYGSSPRYFLKFFRTNILLNISG